MDVSIAGVRQYAGSAAADGDNGGGRRCAAEELGHEIKVETQGSVGAENALTEQDIAAADAMIIAADKDVPLDRFAGKRLVTAASAPASTAPRISSSAAHRHPCGRDRLTPMVRRPTRPPPRAASAVRCTSR